jgi:hypothetical protein
VPVANACQHDYNEGATLQSLMAGRVVHGSLDRLWYHHRLGAVPYLRLRYAVPSEKLRSPLRGRHPPHARSDASLGIIEVEDGPLPP